MPTKLHSFIEDTYVWQNQRRRADHARKIPYHSVPISNARTRQTSCVTNGEEGIGQYVRNRLGTERNAVHAIYGAGARFKDWISIGPDRGSPPTIFPTS
jgi:hypothetical protein